MKSLLKTCPLFFQKATPIPLSGKNLYSVILLLYGLSGNCYHQPTLWLIKELDGIPKMVQGTPKWHDLKWGEFQKSPYKLEYIVVAQKKKKKPLPFYLTIAFPGAPGSFLIFTHSQMAWFHANLQLSPFTNQKEKYTVLSKIHTQYGCFLKMTPSHWVCYYTYNHYILMFSKYLYKRDFGCFFSTPKPF